MMKNLSAFILFIFSSVIIFAQSDTTFKNTKGLSHSLNSYELSIAQNYTRSFEQTDPPTGTVRNIAEWENMESVIVAYDYGFGVPYSMLATISQYTNITVLVGSSSEQNTVNNLLNNNGVNTANCTFVIHDVDSWWSRDYSPWFIAVDNQTVSIVDFPYNRPRPNDDDVPSVIAAEFDIPYYGMNVVHTGGNYMTDGYGQSVSTDLVTDENSISETEICNRMNQYLGITNYHILPDPLDDYIKHIDCWGKFVAVDKVIITQVPESDYRYADYEAAAAYFENTNCSFGYPYHVYRVQASDYYDDDTNPYTNSLILNGKVFVPQTGSEWDDEAIDVYEQAMPGYEIIGVFASGASWYNTDALHCRTHGIADRNMLFVKHFPLFDTISSTQGFEISADVYSYAGNDIQNGYPKLFYSVNDDAYQEIQMDFTAKGNYTATIPSMNDTNKISYYIVAEDVTGISAKNPTMGELDPYIFYSIGNNSVSITSVKNENIKIYPNPNNGRFYMWTDIIQNQDITVEIFSTTGQKFYYDNKSINQNGQLIYIDASFLPKGVYFVKVTSKNSIISKKLIIN